MRGHRPQTPIPILHRQHIGAGGVGVDGDVEVFDGVKAAVAVAVPRDNFVLTVGCDHFFFLRSQAAIAVGFGDPEILRTAVKFATFAIVGTKHRHAVTPVRDKHLTEAQKSQTEYFMRRFIGYFALESRLLLNFCASLTLCT
jgi:hypothetical protein